jgi:HAD superfamily hydrolase (TIGR01459 family)
MPSTSHTIPLISAVSNLASGFDAWITDIWGVMHNGVAAHAPAADACTQFRRTGGTVILVTNAPRPHGSVRTQIDQIGVPQDAYDLILTSGDVTRDLMVDWQQIPLFHIGPERDRPIFAGLDITFADAGAAEVILCSGLFDDQSETPEDYADMLAAFKARNIPMICANPDVKVERGERILYCGGALAEAYAALGGSVLYAGKPHAPIYERAFAEIAAIRGAPADKSRILAIGDGLHTDIAGAESAGIPSLFVSSPIHVAAPLTAETLAELFQSSHTPPIAATTALSW